MVRGTAQLRPLPRARLSGPALPNDSPWLARLSRRPTPWEADRWTVLGTAPVVASLAALYAVILAHRRRAREAVARSGNAAGPPAPTLFGLLPPGVTDRKGTGAAVVSEPGQLAHLSRMATLGALSGSLAHELNQPLSSILTNTQAAQRLLDRESPDLDGIRVILAEIVKEDRRADGLIRRLRALLRRGEIQRQPVSVRDCLDDVLLLMRSELVKRGVTAQCALPARLPPVLADPIQLQQVLLNLIINACDAMDTVPPGQRELSLTACADAGDVRVTVRDRGVGLPEDRETVFEPFHSTKLHGLGLGLAICRMILNAHGGRIWAEPNPDRGATFHLCLPRMERPTW